MKRICAIFASFVILLALPLYAQNSHGSITGQVTDPSGAAVAKVPVIVANTDTGYTAEVKTTGSGYYTAPELQPGPYSVTVEANGFKKYVQQGIQVETQENATVNIKLEIGQVSEQVTVSSDAPLIDLADASTGQVLTNQEVQDLPSNGGSPLGFARIEYGAIAKAKHDLASALPYNNSTVDDFSLGGGNSSSNELLLNGVPNMQDSSRTAGFSPFLDAVTEVRVDVFGANSTYGDTSGGTVNIQTKGGTNQLHGSALWYYQAAGCSGLDGTYQSRSANHCDWMAALPWQTTVGQAVPQATHLNRAGFTVGGPILIPKIWDGRNKLFFFYAYEAVVGQVPPTATVGTVPTAAERQGDFSALLALGSGYQMYNPYTSSGSISNNNRTAVPNNCFTAVSTYCAGVPNAGLTLNPIAQAYLQYVPLPNYNGAQTTADGQSNYFTFTPALSNYRSHQARIDYNLSVRNKLWGEAHRSRYITSASNYFHDLISGTASDQIMSGGLLEDVETFNPTLFLDVRGSVTRYDNTPVVTSTGTSPTAFGFPGYLASNSTALALPQITFSDKTSPLSYSAQPGTVENFDTVMLFAALTKLAGPHTLKIGVDSRAYKYSTFPPGAANGTFSFGNGSGSPVSPGTTSSGAPMGESIASFVLGLPTGGSYNITPKFQYDSFLTGIFLQDDWKAAHNWTVSIGLRLEHETPIVESNNHMTTVFSPTIGNSLTVASEANYAAHPSPLLAASNFNTAAGITFASSSARAAYNTRPIYISPRVGLTWAPDAFHEKLAIRLGYGVYVNPYNDYNTSQTYGYSASSTFVSTQTGGLSYIGLSDPFPTALNPIVQPTGPTLGSSTNLGSKMVFYNPNLSTQYAERASLDVQYQFGKSMMVDVGYINGHQVHLSETNSLSAIPLLPYLSRSPYYDQNAVNLLSGSTYKNGGPATTNITNPFKGTPGMTGTYATQSTIAPSLFLQQYPQFISGVTEQLIPGEGSNYNALNARFYKRMSQGLALNAVFEWSRQLGTFNQLNAGDVLNYGETTSDYPFHLSVYGTYQLPFGRGRQFFNGNRFLSEFIGGWQTSLIYQFLSGMPISWGNAIYTGNGWRDFHNVQHSSANALDQHVFNTAVFDTRTCMNGGTSCQNDPTVTSPVYNPTVQPNADNYRTFPAYLLRQDYTNNWDANVQKDTQLTERVQLQLRMDAFNLLNRPQYTTPNVSPTNGAFGTAYGVYGGTLARTTQLGAHIVF